MKKSLMILLAVILIASMIISCRGGEQDEPHPDASAVPSAEPDAEASAEPAPEPSPVQKLLLSSISFDYSLQTMQIPASAIVYDTNLLYLDLDLGLENAELDGCIIPVKLRIDIDSAEQALVHDLYFRAYQILMEPEWQAYRDEREEWCEERRRNLTEEDEKALENASGEEKDAYFFELFEEYWRGRHTDDEFEVLEDILRRYNEAMERNEELENHGDDWMLLLEDCLQTELERLESKGVIILGEWEHDSICYALIPIERLRDFPENHRYGYGVMWLDEGIMQQPEWIELMKEHGLEKLLENVKVI